MHIIFLWYHEKKLVKISFFNFLWKTSFTKKSEKDAFAAAAQSTSITHKKKKRKTHVSISRWFLQRLMSVYFSDFSMKKENRPHCRQFKRFWKARLRSSPIFDNISTLFQTRQGNAINLKNCHDLENFLQYSKLSLHALARTATFV